MNDYTKKYESDGYAIFPQFLTDEECDEMIAEITQLIDHFEPGTLKAIFSTRDQIRNSQSYFLETGDKICFFFEPDAFSEKGDLKQPKHLSINKISHALHDLNPVFSRISRKPEIQKICSDLGYQNPLLAQSMYIFKQPRIGGEVSCHQDATFLFTEPQSVIGFWFALQDATLTNGCMYAAPGEHRRPLKQRFRRKTEGGVTFDELDPMPWPKDGYIPLEVKKGSLILLHGLLPHLSGPNTSDFSRHAYTLHIIEGNAHYAEDNWLQRSKDFPFRGFT